MNNATSVGAKTRARLPSGELATAILATVALVVLAILLLVIQTSRVAATGYKIRELQSTREHWGNLVYQREAEVAALKSLRRIEQEAKTRFKMIAPPSYIYVVADKTPQQK